MKKSNYIVARASFRRVSQHFHIKFYIAKGIYYH